MYHLMWTVSFNLPDVPNKAYNWDKLYMYIRCGVMISVDISCVRSPVGSNQRL